MGTVHGVYLKYVGLSALSYVGFMLLTKDDDGSRLTMLQFLGQTSSRLFMAGGLATTALLRTVSALILGYSAVLNGIIAALFKLEIGNAVS